jgi:predicted RNase H-like nuclease
MAAQTSEQVPASRVAGVDGCKSRWLCIGRDLHTGGIEARLYESAAQLADQDPLPDVIGWDIPIGLAEDGSGRGCDSAARAVLRAPRASSVFTAPIRAALAARSQQEASQITAQRCDGRRVAAQAFGIYAKVREVDALLAARPSLRGRIREVHPEVCFWAWNGGVAIRASKKTVAGQRERLALVEAHFGAGSFTRVQRRLAPLRAPADDILDAFAALWTAERIASGVARTLPEQPRRDALGLRMEMVY